MGKLTARWITLLIATAMAAGCAGWDPNRPGNAENEEQEAQVTIARFRAEDPGLKRFFDNAAGYAVFPTIGKGAIGVGGAHGDGRVYRGGQFVGAASMTQFTIGFQWGGQAYSEIIFFKDQRALNDFMQSNFEFGAQASAVAATLGASADAAYEKGVAVFTMTKGGLMYEASVGGQKFKFYPR